MNIESSVRRRGVVRSRAFAYFLGACATSMVISMAGLRARGRFSESLAADLD
jgi:hypothetical protein